MPDGRKGCFSTPKERRFILTHSLRVQSTVAGRVCQQEPGEAIVSCLRQEAQRDECWYSNLFFLIQSKNAAHRMVPPTLKLDLLF